MKFQRMKSKKHTPFWYARAILACGLMLLSLTIFTSAFAQQDTADKTADKTADQVAEKADVAVNEVSDKVAEPAKDTSAPPVQPKTAESFGKGARLMSSFTVFLLAVFVGVEVINKVPPTLHTPLMSGSNAISGITVIGALLTAGHIGGGFGAMLGMIAVVLAMINVVGGYLVTHRMLMMFKKR